MRHISKQQTGIHIPTQQCQQNSYCFCKQCLQIALCVAFVLLSSIEIISEIYITHVQWNNRK